MTDLQIELLYARLPRIACRRLCVDACGSIKMSAIEWRRICAEIGYEPRHEVTERGSRLIGFPEGRIESMDDLAKSRCPLLTKDGLCSVYRLRPAICHLFGLVERMRCPFGCIPERWVSDEEARELLLKLEQAN